MRPRVTMRRALGPILAVTLLGAACGGDESAGTTEDATPEPAPAEATAPPSPAESRSPTALVVDYYNALNSGHVEGMVAEWPDGDRGYFALLADTLGERASVDCSPGDTASSVICNEFVGNHFFDPAGVRATFTMRYTVADGVIVAGELVTSGEEVAAYRAAFGEWLRANDPDLYEASYQLTGGRLPVSTSTDALAIVAKVEQFVTESDTYPLPR